MIKLLKSYDLPFNHCKFPLFYPIPKFHKNPVGFRFITTTVNTTLKETSKLFNKILDVIKDSLEDSWIIYNNKPILDTLLRINESKENLLMHTYDFKTLYTSLPHADLSNTLVSLFESQIKDSINIIYNNKKYFVDKNKFQHILELLLNHCYIMVNNNLFRQIKGIPMGESYSSNMANLYLYDYESLNSVLLGIDNEFDYVFRYIDDLYLLNNNKCNDRKIKLLYPDELVIENTTGDSNQCVHYLDLEIFVHEHEYYTKVYDKRRAFNFEIVGLCSPFSNIPNKTCKNVMTSQFLRFAHICSFKKDFVYNCVTVASKLIGNGLDSNTIHSYIGNFFKNNNWINTKYDSELIHKEILNMLL